VSLRRLVHLVGTDLRLGGGDSQQPHPSGDNGRLGGGGGATVKKLLTTHESSFRAERAGELAIVEKFSNGTEYLADLYTSPLNGAPLTQFPTSLKGHCQLCSIDTTDVGNLAKHVIGKQHLKALKRAPCRLCQPVDKADVVLLRAAKAGQIFGEFHHGGGARADLYHLRPEGVSLETVRELFGRIACEPCAMSWVPQRCPQELLAHLQSDQHQRRLLLAEDWDTGQGGGGGGVAYLPNDAVTQPAVDAEQCQQKWRRRPPFQRDQPQQRLAAAAEDLDRGQSGGGLVLLRSDVDVTQEADAEQRTNLPPPFQQAQPGGYGLGSSLVAATPRRPLVDVLMPTLTAVGLSATPPAHMDRRQQAEHASIVVLQSSDDGKTGAATGSDGQSVRPLLAEPIPTGMPSSDSSSSAVLGQTLSESSSTQQSRPSNWPCVIIKSNTSDIVDLLSPKTVSEAEQLVAAASYPSGEGKEQSCGEAAGRQTPEPVVLQAARAGQITCRLTDGGHKVDLWAWQPAGRTRRQLEEQVAWIFCRYGIREGVHQKVIESGSNPDLGSRI
jgi:hypothetical protein